MNGTRVDVVIVGGGVAGLWCRWSLQNAGYSVLLIERSALGCEQTGASQGILHRGVKYALSADAARAAASADESARAWDESMSGNGGPDLRGVRVLADSMLMWTDGGLLSKLTGAVASRVLTSHVVPADTATVPEFLGFRGRTVYRVSEKVIDPTSAVRCLVNAGAGPIAKTRIIGFESRAGGVAVSTEHGVVHAGAAVLCGGEGNEELLHLAGANAGAWMQRRPLHMVAAFGVPGPLFGHWIASASDKPRLTVTSANVGEQPGTTAWYLGGVIAEEGVDRSEGEQISAARAELQACFPGLDVHAWKYRTLRVNRAEGKDEAGRRPDTPVVRAVVGTCLIAAWPTKLVMAPAAADEVLRLIRARMSPGEPGGTLVGAPAPGYSVPAWQKPE